MFCEAYNQPLTDAAAAGEQLSPALQQHLASCDACRSAFADEQNLFAAIDSGLRAAANSEVPPTLIPRVRVALNNEPVPQPNFQKWLFAGAVLTCSAVMAIAIQFTHREVPVPGKTLKVQTSIATSPQLTNALPAIPPARRETPRQSNRAETAQPTAANTDASISAEVLVPDEERVAFAKFLTGEQSLPAKSAVSLVPEGPKELVPLPAVEIASLKVLPLNGEEDGQGEF
jgi:hypothetical protein